MKQYDRFKYVLPPVITALLLFIIYAVKHIYPFGNLTIDYYDLSNQIVTYYCHVYDVLHGSKNLFYDMYTAFGTNMVGTCGSSNISIFNLFFLFIKRESILPLMSVFLMIKMMAMSLTMYVFLNKVTKAPDVYKVIFSVGYAFSGFVLTTYTIIEWQDIVAYFPLIMLGLYLLITEGKTKLYTIMLVVALIAGYYITFLILIFIFLTVGFGVADQKLTGNQKDYHVVKLFISTVLAMMMSSFVVVPQVMQTLASQRFSSESGGGAIAMYMELVKNVKPAYTSRWFILANLSLPITVIIYSIITKVREDKTENIKNIIKYTVFVCIMLGTEFILESVNLIWHYGSYVHYPLRNGFLMTFCIYVIACECLMTNESSTKDTTLEDKEKTPKQKSAKKVVISACTYAFTIAASLAFSIAYSKVEGLVLRNVFHIFVIVSFCLIVLYFLLLYSKRQNVRNIIPALYIAEIVFMGFVFLGKPNYTTGYTEEPEMEDNYYYICSELNDSLALGVNSNGNMDSGNSEEWKYFSRIKNPDTSLNSNYGLVLKRPVLSNWTALLSESTQDDAKVLGYSVQYTRLLDAGGTVFSDALLGIKEIISCVDQNAKLYALKDTADIVSDRYLDKHELYSLYDCRYTLPFGVVVDNTEYGFEGADICAVYNNIYKSISRTDDIIAEYIPISERISVDGEKALYYLSNQTDTDDYNTSLRVNGAPVLVPSISELNNTSYPAHFNNNTVLLGVFSNEEVSFEMSVTDVDKYGNKIENVVESKLLSIDLDKLSALMNSYTDQVSLRRARKNGYDFSVSSSQGKEYLLLPMSYDKGYTVKVNGESVELLPARGLLSAIELNEGTNNIEIRFMPYGMKTGIVISCIGIVLCAIYFMLDKNSIFEKRCKWLESVYFVGFIAVTVLMYIVPASCAVLVIAGIL